MLALKIVIQNDGVVDIILLYVKQCSLA